MPDDNPHRRPWWVVPGAVIATVPLLLLGVVVGGWPGLILVLVFATILVAIALDS